jgi:uncharacterized protein (DUF885 family)
MDAAWHDRLVRHPELATQVGERGLNDQLADLSAAAIGAELEAERGFLARLDAIPAAQLDEEDALDAALLRGWLREGLDAAPFKPWEMPLTQLGGAPLDFAEGVASTPFEREQDYTDFLARLRAFPAQTEQVVALMRQGLADGLMPPRVLLEKAAAEADDVCREPDDCPFLDPFSKWPDGVPEARRAALKAEAERLVRTVVRPEYERLARFVRDEYAPHGTDAVGLWGLPDGAQRYALAVRQQTTTTLGADEIHALGLAEVARLRAEVQALVAAQGQPDLAHCLAFLNETRPVRADTAEAMLQLYRTHISEMETVLPRLFGRLPKARVEVRAVEAFRAGSAPGAEYNEGTPDGSRPGMVMVNTGLAGRGDASGAEATAYHEGVPGHHLQLSLAQELGGLPAFRKHLDYGAYVEGWALYAEGLGREVGFYRLPSAELGRLRSELFRAVRLVVDTGLHARRWSRARAVDYMVEQLGSLPEVAGREVDRYLASPGQALGYKIGQLKILALRRQAEAALGPAFDLRAFHDEVLGAGALPLDLLEARLQAWIAVRRATADGR